jgi:hypothetical protein
MTFWWIRAVNRAASRHGTGVRPDHSALYTMTCEAITSVPVTWHDSGYAPSHAWWKP